MEIRIRSRRQPVPETLQRLIERKIGKLERFLDRAAAAEVELTTEATRAAAERHVVQVTLNAQGTLVRAEERADDVASALDAVEEKLRTRLARLKGRLHATERGAGPLRATLAAPPGEEEPRPRGVVRVKRFSMKPIDVEEAIELMHLLGHDWYVFFNSADQQVNVVYQRADGSYGLIQPELS